MADDLNSWRGAVAALAGAAALGAAGAAEAHDWKKHHHRHHAPPGYVIVSPGHAYTYAPAPVVVYPQPVVYAPVHYAPAYPVYGPPVGSLNFGVTLPLR